jgi:NADH-quinone oxidoreductase subunit L
LATAALLLTIGLPWLGAVILWSMGDRDAGRLSWTAIGTGIASVLACLLLLPGIGSGVEVSIPIGGIFGAFTLRADGLGVLLALIATVVGCLAVIFSVDYMRGEEQLARYYALVMIFIGAMTGLVLTSSLLFLFLFWEITAFCSYALISFHNDDPKAVYGGIKALIITSFGGIGLLIGALMAFGALGSYEINDLLASYGRLPPATLNAIAFTFLVAAAAKSAQFPFHSWLPDAMEAPTPISALIHAATMVNAGVYLLARFAPAFSQVTGWQQAVIAVGVISALLAGWMAIVTGDLKRLLAYSTISQLGFMVYAIGVGADFAADFHLLNHALFKALLFLAAGAVIHAVGTRELNAMGGLGKSMPFTQWTFVIGSLALAGIPIFNGFWSKELIFESGSEHGSTLAFGLMLLSAVMTACYALRACYLVFWAPPGDRTPPHDAPGFMRVSLGALSIGAAGSWLLAGPLSSLLASSLPFHRLNPLPTGEMVAEVLHAPVSAVGLAAAGLGLAVGWWLLRPARRAAFGGWLAELGRADFGFNAINHAVEAALQRGAEALRMTQSGDLNWNVVGIVGGLVLLLGVVAARGI